MVVVTPSATRQAVAASTAPYGARPVTVITGPLAGVAIGPSGSSIGGPGATSPRGVTSTRIRRPYAA